MDLPGENARGAAVLSDRWSFGVCLPAGADLGFRYRALAWAGGGYRVAEAARRPARARSRNTAAAAVSRAAATAIRVICHPAMPPTVITRTRPPVVAGAVP